MRTRLLSMAIGAGALIAGATPAMAQAALDEDEDDVAPATTESTEEEVEDPNRTRIGAGIRLRRGFVPQGLIELFVESAPGGSSEWGFGIEVVRRKGDFEVQFAVQSDSIYVKDGYWVDKGDEIPADEPDFVTFDSFGWISAEVTFLNHSPIIDQLAIRYGGGAGIAVVRGEVSRDDAICTSPDFDSCMHPYAGAENIDEPYDIPPVMLIVNAVLGVQIRPIDNLFINIEGGLRTIPFFGITAGGFFK